MEIKLANWNLEFQFSLRYRNRLTSGFSERVMTAYTICGVAFGVNVFIKKDLHDRFYN